MFSFLWILLTRTLTTRFHVKITHNSFCWFSIRLFDTVKYELIVLYLFMTTLIPNFSPKYGQICWTRPYLFVKITKDMIPLKTMWKYTHSMKTLTKSTTQSCYHVLSNNQIFEMISWSLYFGDRLIFTYSLKPFRFTYQILNRFYHYLILSATKDKINLNKI